MPTKNPRLTMTLTATTAAQLRALSTLTGNSQASLISDLLEGSEPVFARLIEVLTAAKEATAELKGAIGADLVAAETRMEAQLGLALGEFDRFTGNVLSEAESIKRRRTKQGAGAIAELAPAPASTPMSNRGVRSTTKTGKSPNEKQGVKRGSI